MSDDEMEDPPPIGKSNDLLSNVTKWLDSEGYPTEFRAANVFKKHGFHAVQGTYVPGDLEGSKREIDVVGSNTVTTSSSAFLQVCYIAECKWSASKPWVVFTSSTNLITPSSCIEQTIATQLGSTIAWIISDKSDLYSFQMFSMPENSGFGGRQAFNKGNDLFYSAIQTVVGNSHAYVAEFEQLSRAKGQMPKAAVFAFPIVIVEGQIFRAAFDSVRDKIILEPANEVRCHWRGSPSSQYFATVDLVSMEYLDKFLHQRAKEVKAHPNYVASR